MRFALPWALLWLALVPALGVLLFASLTLRRRRLERFVSSGILPRLLIGASVGRVVALGSLRLGAIALVILALARPQWGKREEPVVRKGVDVVLALDLSASMLAEDVSPNRLEQARAEAVSLVGSLMGDRVALVPFGGRAAVVCPLTADYGAVRLFLDAADASFAPGGGTDLARAIDEAVRLLTSGGSAEKRYKTIVLLTDGEDLEGHGLEAVARAREGGIIVHAIGVGTPQGGPIPLRDENGKLTGYKKDREGRVVTTRFDPTELEKIALETDGTFLRSGPAGDAGAKVAEAISKMEKREIAARLATRFEDRYQIPLIGALVLLVIEAAWIPRRKTSAEQPEEGAVKSPRPRRAAREAGAAAPAREIVPGDAAAPSPTRPRAPGDAAVSGRGVLVALGAILAAGLAAPLAVHAAGPDGDDRHASASDPSPSPSPPGSKSGAPFEDEQGQDAGRVPEPPGEEKGEPSSGAGSGASKNRGGSKSSSASPNGGYLNAGRAPTAGVARANRDGNRLYGHERYSDALSKYEEAGAAAPDLPAVRYNIGNALLRGGKYKEAASEYQRALQSAPPAIAPAIRYNLGNAQFLQGQYKDAAESYMKVLERAPADEAARRNLELALRALKRPEQQQSHQSDPKDSKDNENEEKNQSSGGAGKQQQQEEGKQENAAKSDQDRKDAGQPKDASEQEQQGQSDKDRAQGKEREGKKNESRRDRSSQQRQDAKIGRNEAERLLDSLAEEEKKDLKRRMARQPREEGPEKDW